MSLTTTIETTTTETTTAELGLSEVETALREWLVKHFDLPEYMDFQWHGCCLPRVTVTAKRSTTK